MLKDAEDTRTPWFEQEMLSAEQRYHERLMTSLRTIWGFDPELVEDTFKHHFLEKVQPYLLQGLIEHVEGRYILSRSGKLLADRITMELF